MTWQLAPGLPASSRASRGSGVALNRPVPCVGACPGRGGACPFLGTVEDASRKGQKGSGRGGHLRFAITRGRGRSAPRTGGIRVNAGCLEARPPHSWALWLGEVAGPLTLTVLICHWGLSRGRPASVSPKGYARNHPLPFSVPVAGAAQPAGSVFHPDPNERAWGPHSDPCLADFCAWVRSRVLHPSAGRERLRATRPPAARVALSPTAGTRGRAAVPALAAYAPAGGPREPRTGSL